MAFSPALAHRQRTLAALAAGSASAALALPEISPDDPAAGEYAQLLASLHNDLRTLHDIQSVDAKIARKRDMIDAYLPWVNGALDAGEDGRANQDEIVVTILVWALDIQNWDLALTLASHVLEHGLALPERYKRTPACLVVEEIADAAKADPAAVPLDVLLRTQGGAAGHDMPDQVKAKLLRAIGLAWSAKADAFDPTAEDAMAGGKAAMVDASLTALKEARRLHAQVGVAKAIEKLEREAKALADDAAQGDGQ